MRVTVRLPEPLAAALADYGQRHGMDTSTVIREALTQYLQMPHPSPLDELRSSIEMLERRLAELESYGVSMPAVAKEETQIIAELDKAKSLIEQFKLR